MGFINGLFKTLGFESEENIGKKETKQVSIKTSKNNAEYDLKKEEEQKIVVCPVNQSDIQKITDMLVDGKNVSVNLEKLSSAEYVRALDFLSGATYALGGKIKKIGDKIFSFII